MTAAPNRLALVPPPPEPAEKPVVDQITERRRALALSRTIARIGGQRPADDTRHYSGGHVWRRNRDHETMVLRVLQGRSFG